MAKKITTTVNKSAITGKFVSDKKLEADPKHTYKQTVTRAVNKKRK